MTEASASEPRPSSWRPYCAEWLGSALLVLVGTGSILVAARSQAFGPFGIALAFGGVVTAVILLLGPISGAHINPAVTVALWTLRRHPGRDVLPYLLAQCAGAMMASGALWLLWGPDSSMGATVPTVPLWQAVMIEAGYSAVLMAVILLITSRPIRWPALPALVIGATVTVGALLTGPLTGGSFNPARSLGPAVAANLWTAHWIYWAAPIAGMVAAGQAWQWWRRDPTVG